MPVSKYNNIPWANLSKINGIVKGSIKKICGIPVPSPTPVEPEGWSPPMVQNIDDTTYTGTKAAYTYNTSGTIQGAFDGDLTFSTGRWEMIKSDIGSKYGYVDMGVGVVVQRISFYNLSDYSRAVRSIKFSVSNDGSNWTVWNSDLALENTGWTVWNNYTNTIAYRYYKFEPLTNDGDVSYANLIEINLQGDSSLYTSFKMNLPNSYPSNQYTSYGVLNGSNQVGYWVGSGQWQFSVVNGGWIKWDAEALATGNKPTIKSVRIKSGSAASNRCVRAFKIRGSNDDSIWTDLYDSAVSGEAIQDNTILQSFTLTTTGAYRYYQLIWTTNWGGSYVIIDAWHLYT